MRRPIKRRVCLVAAAALIGGAAVAVAPINADAAPVAKPSAAPTTAPPATPSAAPAAESLYSLPTGDHVRVTGSGQSARADFLPAPGHSAAAVTSNVDGRITVVPVSQVGKISSLDAFQVGSATPRSPAATPFFPMTTLHITALDHSGQPVPAAEVIAVNTDDPARANWDGIMTAGDSRIEVPAGHYSVAVAAFETDSAGNATETDLLSVTDVTVPAAGTTVALDGRGAQQVAFTTPQPSTLAAAVLGWDRGTAGHLDYLDIGALAGTKFYVGSAAKANYGVLQFSMFGRQSAGSSSYLLAFPNYDQIPASQTYAAGALETVDSTYATDEPKQDLTLTDLWNRVGSGSSELPSYPDLPSVTVHAPTKARQYIAAVAGASYEGLMLPANPDGSLDGELERDFVPAAGQHVTLAWRGTVITPAPSTYDGPCFLCRNGNTLNGVDEMDTDGGGDVGQWSDGPTTIAEDGKQIYSGGTEGQLFTLALPAAKHHYVYSLDTTHDTVSTALSTHTQISWGFDSAKTTASTPLPILYTRAQFVTDGHDSVGTGTGTVNLAFEHLTGATDNAVKGASVSVSYDDGATWHPATVTLGNGHQVSATWPVPANTKAGYLALKISATDAGGSTLAETVHHAALVNAPGGIAVTGSGSSGTSGGAAGVHAVCPSADTGHVRCFALTSGVKQSLAKGALPAGLARNDLLSAYKLPTTGGAGRTVAIVDAHDDPQAESDLAVYRSTYGLPACTTANGCFKKVNEHGQTSPLPAHDPNDDWNPEVSLDLDMVSAVCPACHILLVESDGSDTASLGTAEQTATGSGAVAVSNSWGGDEGSENQAWNSAFQHPGVAVTVSSGDNGFIQGAWPASLSTVIAVGGTSLSKDTSTRGWNESTWKGGGSGCSAYVPKPAWQHDAHCPNRTVADVAAVADPKTGVAVYVEGGWNVIGGTSASSPIIASMIALAGNSAALTSAEYIYSHTANFFDVTTGSNANWDCGGDYLCNAGPGYDAPTGIGTPNGLGGL
ncbi:S53 family peptidase [Catenulispora pinisilvae]|uniref:S53 family peptidase n=1 Tax=Catenulispora pinisilvae TaxID=2705253 RepID=UPI001E38EF42|nr:S53 family peptidase [Catenulispora pinisilvae]